MINFERAELGGLTFKVNLMSVDVLCRLCNLRWLLDKPDIRFKIQAALPRSFYGDIGRRVTKGRNT